MKKILIVYIGGTICSFVKENGRDIYIEMAKKNIMNNFEKSSSEFANYANELFEEIKLDFCTLSENMTIGKLNIMLNEIKENISSDFSGIIILHGTDTLAYTSSILSLSLQHINIPMILVSANKPVDEKDTNANINFRTAVELIMRGIAPNVYALYRNSDKKMYLHLGSTLMQCNDFSEDFYNASKEKCFVIEKGCENCTEILSKCWEYSAQRLAVKVDYENSEEKELQDYNETLINRMKKIEDTVLCIKPYVGLDYKKIDLKGVKAIVHRTYHSGTVCVERNNENEKYSSNSILYLADKCQKKQIPIYIAHCILNDEQYCSAFDAVNNGKIIPLNMTFESAYAKVLVGVSCGYSKEELNKFVLTEINNEFVKQSKGNN